MDSKQIMKDIEFYKMSGSGNDFILIDNRDDRVKFGNMAAFVSKVCKRAVSVGADGLILVEAASDADFRWRFFNADGSVAEMCGNGARCVARFAYLTGIAGPDMRFETLSGTISARVTGERVRLKMTDPGELQTDISLQVAGETLHMSSINTGVPHVVIEVEALEAVDVRRLGGEIRFHERFSPAGTNVNFIRHDGENKLAIRTYERGVEDETLACGTGAVAAAVVTAFLKGWPPPIALRTRSGGILTIHFTAEGGRFIDVHLEGDARLIYRGELGEEAWNYA